MIRNEYEWEDWKISFFVFYITCFVRKIRPKPTMCCYISVSVHACCKSVIFLCCDPSSQKNPYLMVCARLAQLVRSLTANQAVPGSIPGLVEGWTLGNLLLPHRPWTGTLSRWSNLSRHSIGGLKRTHTLIDGSRLMPVWWDCHLNTAHSNSL